jgi:hypothetical protein
VFFRLKQVGTWWGSLKHVASGRVKYGLFCLISIIVDACDAASKL